MLEVHRWRQIEWAPSAVVALATSVDGTVVAAARESGAIELWNVAPGSVGWHCHLTIPGKENAAISSLVWCKASGGNLSRLGRLFSAGLDGFITEWDLQTLQPKEVVESYGGSVWQLAVEPVLELKVTSLQGSNGVLHQKPGEDSDSDESSSGSENDSDDEEEEKAQEDAEQRVAVGCDDGCVRLFTVSNDQSGMMYRRCFPRVKGRILSVAWSTDSSRIFAGGSDGCIRCWDSTKIRELFRITAGIGGLGGGADLCVWSLLALRDGTIVSGDSTGSTQFWEGKHGTLLQVHSKHTADVLALAATPSHNGVYAAGADGQVSLYQHVDESIRVIDGSLKPDEHTMGALTDKWIYVGSKRTHSHDVKALAVAYPLVSEDGQTDEHRPGKRRRGGKRHKGIPDMKRWAHPGTAMLISGGSDTKLFTYPANAFLAFHPHDICPAPQRPHIQLASELNSNGATVLVAQHSTWIDVWKINTNQSAIKDMAQSVEFGKDILGKRKSRDEKNHHSGSHAKINGSVEGKKVFAPEGTNASLSEGKKGSSLALSNGKVEGSHSSYRSTQLATAKGVGPGLLARIKCKTSEHIACSAISSNGQFVAFSDRMKPRLYQLEQQELGAINSKKMRGIMKKKLPMNLPAAQCMLFTSDSTRLLLGCPQQILVIDVKSTEIMHSFRMASPKAFGVLADENLSPINFMCTSADSQWLAVTTSAGYIHVFSLETLRHHWSVRVMDGSVATSAIFRPSSSNLLIIGTAGNQLHVLDVEAKELTEWSKANGEAMASHLLEFPGGITGLSVPPTATSTCVIAYSSRAMCQIDFSKPVKAVDGEVIDTATKHEMSKRSSDARSAVAKKSDIHTNGNGVGHKHNGSANVHSNFVLVPFKDPVLFLGHTAQSSILVVEKAWLEVLRQFPAPVYRHLYGT